MQPHTSLKEVRQFIGVVNYYHGVWTRRWHTLPPLTKIASNKAKFIWTIIKQDSFNEIKRVVALDNLSTYPDFNEELKIHTNASDFQLGVFISQKGRQIDLYSRKLLKPQKGIQ